MDIDTSIVLLAAAVLVVTAPVAAQSDAVGLEADSQPTNAENVTIKSVSIDDDGWIVIHPEGDQYSPDANQIYGTTYVEAGSHQNVTVNLSSTLLINQSLYAMLHYDDPADGEFTFPNDSSEDPPVSTTQPYVERQFYGNVSVDHFYVVIGDDTQQNRLIAEREGLEIEEARREQVKEQLEEENQQLEESEQDDDQETTQNDSSADDGDEEGQPGFAVVGALAALIAAAALLRQR
jgi:PGF-CTERM protein